MTKMYIAVLDEVPDYIVPTLVAHSVINANTQFEFEPEYEDWCANSFKKVTIRVNKKEFQKICEGSLPVWLGNESTVLNEEICCAVVFPVADEKRPNVLKYAKLWEPKYPIIIKDKLYQYDDNVYVWFDEAGLIGGASNLLPEAEKALNAYVKEIL